MDDFSVIDNIIQQFKKGKFGIFISPQTSFKDYDDLVSISRYLQWNKDETTVGVSVTPTVALDGRIEGWNLSKKTWHNNNSVELFALKSVSLQEISEVLSGFLEKTYAND